MNIKKLLSPKAILAIVIALCILLSTIFGVPFLRSLSAKTDTESGEEPSGSSSPSSSASSKEPTSSGTLAAPLLPGVNVPTTSRLEDLLDKDTTIKDDGIDDTIQLQEAAAILTERIAKTPEDAKLYTQRAAIYYYLEKYDECLRDYTSALQYDPDPKTYYYRASVYVQTGAAQKAYDDLKICLADDPDKSDYLSLFADTCNALKKYSEALQALKKLIAKDNDNAILYALAGDACVYLSDFAGSIPYYRDALNYFNQATEKAGISKAALYSAYGNSLKTAQNYTEAANAYTEAIKLSDQKEFYFQRGFCRLQTAQYEPAIQDFTQCVQRNYEVAISKFQRGLCYYSVQNYEAAISDFQAYETAYPTKNDTHLYMGLCYQSLKDYASAIPYYEKSIAANLSVGDCSFNLGNCLYNQEKFAEAIPYYTTAIELNAQLYPALLNRGVAYVKTNKYNEAKVDLKRVIDECDDTTLVESASKSYEPIKNITIITK